MLIKPKLIINNTEATKEGVVKYANQLFENTPIEVRDLNSKLILTSNKWTLALEISPQWIGYGLSIKDKDRVVSLEEDTDLYPLFEEEYLHDTTTVFEGLCGTLKALREKDVYFKVAKKNQLSQFQKIINMPSRYRSEGF